MKQRHLIAGLGVSALSAALMGGTAFAGNQGYSSYTPDLLPPNPQAGVCYARVKVPAQYETRSQSVVVEEGYSKIEVSQPELASRQETIMVKEASVEYRVRQPRYQSVTEQVMVRPAYDKLSVSHPQFSTVTETIRVSEPRLVWKKGNPAKLRSQGYVIHSTADAGSSGRGYSSTTQYGQATTGCGTVCEIWCLVEEPGQSVSYNRKVMTSPGEVRRHSVPAKYQTVTKQVLADPGGVEEIPIPPQYKTITVEDVVNPGGEYRVDVPAKYGEVATKVPVSAERYEWRQVVCKPGTSGYSGGSTGYSSSSSYGSGYSSSGTTTYGSGSSYSHGSGTTTYGSGTTYGHGGATTTYGSGHSSGGHYSGSTSCGTSTTCNTYSHGSSAKRVKHRYRR